MSKSVEKEEVDHLVHSVGGLKGHLLRRSIHLLMAGLPIVFYWHGDTIGALVHLSAEQVVSLILLLLVVAETLRLTLGLTVYGQREYEAMFAVCIGRQADQPARNVSHKVSATG